MKLNNSNLLRIAIAIACAIAGFLIIFGGALNWSGLDTSNIKLETVTGVITAFIIVAATIERAGQVVINLISDQKKKRVIQNKVNQSNRLVRQLSEEKRENSAYQRVLLQTSTFSPTANPSGGQTSGSQIASVMNQVNSNSVSLDRRMAHEIELQSTNAQELAEIENKEDGTHLKVALPLSILVTIAGLHFLESLFGGPPATDFYISDPQHLTELMEKVDQSIQSIEGFKTELVSTYQKADMTQLRTFRIVDFLITTLLLTGGAAGLRNLLKAIGTNNNADG